MSACQYQGAHRQRRQAGRQADSAGAEGLGSTPLLERCHPCDATTVVSEGLTRSPARPANQQAGAAGRWSMMRVAAVTSRGLVKGPPVLAPS